MLVDGVVIDIQRIGNTVVLLLQAKPFGHKVAMTLAQAGQLNRELAQAVAPTHYETLGIERTATTDEIKKAYRRMSRQHHPDHSGQHAAMTHVNEASAVLSNPEQRKQYDANLKGAP